MTDRINALRRALELSPEDDALRAMLIELLLDDGQEEDALVEAEIVNDGDSLSGSVLMRLADAAISTESRERALHYLDLARRSGVVEGLADLERRIAELREQVVVGRETDGPPLDLDAPITFDAVGGLAEVKKLINRTIVLPFTRPDLYEAYDRSAGGGVLLYGPPGCGKTLIAKATAGELGLPFYNLRIEDVVGPFFGTSERNLALAFDRARELSPCVLFIDEVDALGYARSRRQSDTGRQLADVFLTQLDSVGTDTTDVLVLAATNEPWDLDAALIRTGRFDRQVFVPPPDLEAREAIIEITVRNVHRGNVDARAIAKSTALFSGADLRGVVEQAVDLVIDEALESGGRPPLGNHHLQRVLDGFRPTTLDWLLKARSYVEYSNQSERWDDVAAYLRSREGKKALRRWVD